MLGLSPQVDRDLVSTRSQRATYLRDREFFVLFRPVRERPRESCEDSGLRLVEEATDAYDSRRRVVGRGEEDLDKEALFVRILGSGTEQSREIWPFLLHLKQRPSWILCWRSDDPAGA